MSLIEQITDVMEDHTGAAHVSDIATMSIERFPHTQECRETLISKVSSVLASDVKKASAKSSFSKPKNKQGGYKKGIYRLKRKQEVKPVATVAPKVSTQFTGKAGETAVISELLFYGFNASAMAVDDGIDLIAEKENKYFHIQVKTANPSISGSYSFTIKKSSFSSKHSYQTFYIFVLRDGDETRYFNDYLILPSSEILQLINTGIVKDGTNFSVNVQKDKKGRYLVNAKRDVTISVNTFSQVA